ncbi:hypothetical protein H0H93_014803 [Arthromyces matolae]|nr:hypothetical protein H0H93_014803 [Arthromyces matolae]
MFDSLAPFAVVVGAPFIVFCTWSFWKANRKATPSLPPGPPSDPFIGHARIMPTKDPEFTFHEWGKIYGDVIYLEVLGRPIVVLNSSKAALDLLEKRSVIHSDRPRSLVLDIMGWPKNLTLVGYADKTFQRYRKMFQEHLSTTKSKSHRAMQTQEARMLLQNLLANEEDREKYIRRFVTSVIVRIAYGLQVTSEEEDPYVQIVSDVGHVLSNAGPPAHTPIDFYPFLQYLPSWFPGTEYAEFARKHKHIVTKMHDYPFRIARERLAAGTAKTSFVSQMMDSLGAHNAEEGSEVLMDIKINAANMIGAGAETTWSTLSFFFLAMILHPEYQRRAQQEIDSVIGPGRLPEFSDRESLPYLECILQETFRGMALDENVYTNPQTFNPSRYLPSPEGNSEPYLNAQFGFGRRICPGRHLADANLWIAMVSILATFDISKAIGTDGKEITPKVGFISGITSSSGYTTRGDTSADKTANRSSTNTASTSRSGYTTRGGTYADKTVSSSTPTSSPTSATTNYSDASGRTSQSGYTIQGTTQAEKVNSPSRQINGTSTTSSIVSANADVTTRLSPISDSVDFRPRPFPITTMTSRMVDEGEEIPPAYFTNLRR